MDVSPQAVRQLRYLDSQEPILRNVTVGVSHFERCALWVQVLSYPFYGSGTPADFEGNYSEEVPQIMRQKKSLSPELGEPVIFKIEVSRNVDLGDETTTMICKFVVRASDVSITKEIGSDLLGWLDDLTNGSVEYMPEDEVKAAAAEKLRTSMERIALLKAARP
ncbi:unnamed protein product [Fraxinus pennsylvanica]|uniref:Uncharacterized protein n=1 Tax=Fraxinus pennsylvanica TaxID=56036 RepID=A0AAD2DIG9_9LAMI|nr:unnamed protein product [Fraxinus pennsylvanica]